MKENNYRTTNKTNITMQQILNHNREQSKIDNNPNKNAQKYVIFVVDLVIFVFVINFCIFRKYSFKILN